MGGLFGGAAGTNPVPLAEALRRKLAEHGLTFTSMRRASRFELHILFSVVDFEEKRLEAQAHIGLALPTPEAVLDGLRQRAEVACRVAKVRRHHGPLTWSDDAREDALIDKRWRCSRCQATVTLLLPSKDLQAKVFCCINCGEPFPAEPDARS